MSDYRNFKSSLLRFCSQFADDRNSFGCNLSVVNFDAFAQIEDLPAGDLIGLGSYELTIREGFHEVEFMIGVSTQEDTNNFRLTEFIDLLLGKLEPEQIIQVVGATDGVPLGIMTLSEGTKAMAVSGSHLRPGVFIHCRALSRRS